MDPALAQIRLARKATEEAQAAHLGEMSIEENISDFGALSAPQP
jgi:hypothetical protein